MPPMSKIAGVSRVARRVHAQVDPVDLDDPLTVHQLSGAGMR